MRGVTWLESREGIHQEKRSKENIMVKNRKRGPFGPTYGYLLLGKTEES